MKKTVWKPLSVICAAKSIQIELPESHSSTDAKWDSIRGILLERYREHPYWIFRGMRKENYELQTSLERKEIDRGYRKILYHEVQERFYNSVQEYRNIEYIPTKEETLELQSLMQHYGAPTALLDWSYSPYVAAFFATDDANDRCCGNGKIYALNALALYRTLEKYFQSKNIIDEGVSFDMFNDPSIFNRIISYQWSPGEGFILPIEPRRTNSRLRIQQGIFTLNGNIFYSFEENLALLLDFAVKNDPNFNKSKVMRCITINSKLKKEIQEDLFLMNITTASLFPGLEGFSKSWSQIMLRKQLGMDRYLNRIGIRQSNDIDKT